MLGVGPFITASIIMQLMMMLAPKLKSLYQEEGEAGRQRFGQYTRMLTLPLAVIQGAGFLILLERQGIVNHLSPFQFSLNLIIIAAGALLVMWLGELITEFGIGNGASLIIFAGIVAAIPTKIAQYLYGFDQTQIPILVGFIALAVVVISAVVTITEAERPIPITYAKQVRGNTVKGAISTYLPLRMTQAGVIPIIFAISILLFPTMLFNLLSYFGNDTVNNIGKMVNGYLTNNWIYGSLYAVLVFFFTYFYTAVIFDPESIANNLQKGGAFIPGVRPGMSTAEYISNILMRITLVGAFFLAMIAVLPIIVKALTNVQSLVIGGTALLIAVSVILDLIRKIDAQVSMREY
jgi:preprotein translocase subunit SecY